VVCVVTVVAVSDAVLQDGVPLALLLLRRHAEVMVAGVGVPQDERELGRALDERVAARFGLDVYGGGGSHDRARSVRNCCKKI